MIAVWGYCVALSAMTAIQTASMQSYDAARAELNRQIDRGLCVREMVGAELKEKINTFTTAGGNHVETWRAVVDGKRAYVHTTTKPIS